MISNTILQDIRFATRMLLKNPGHTLLILMLLAIGIGANTAIFSIVNALFLRSLPGVESQGQLVWILAGRADASSYPDYKDYRDRNRVFSGMAAVAPVQMSVGVGSQSDVVMGEIVTANYFSVLGVKSAIGRFFLPDEDQNLGQGTSPVAVISHACWQRWFQSDPRITGKTVLLNGQTFVVVGVAPDGFKGVNVAFAPELWVPMTAQPQIMPGSDWLRNRQVAWLSVIGRLNSEMTIERAEAAMKTLDDQIQQVLPRGEREAERTLQLAPVRGVFPALKGTVVGFMGFALTIVMLVLLIACFNVANLLLAQAVTRRQEVAVRLAMGASRSRLIRQFIVESLELSLLGGAVALLVAHWSIEMLSLVKSPTPIPVVLDLALDNRVLIFNFLMAALTGLVFGSVPALHASRIDLATILKNDTSLLGPASRSEPRLQTLFGQSQWDEVISIRSWIRKVNLHNLLVSSQVCVSVVLLVVAGLFARSLYGAYKVAPGFESEKLILVGMDLRLLGYGEHRGKEFYRTLIERVGALPGVKSVTLVQNPPLGLNFRSTHILIEDGATGQKRLTIASTEVGPDYFQTIGIPILYGRDFTAQDHSEARDVVIINQAMATQYFPGQNPVGKRIWGPSMSGASEIVGVAKDAKYWTLSEAPRPFLYSPIPRYYSELTLLVRTYGNPKGIVAAVRREVQSIDPKMPPVFTVKTMRDHLETSLFPLRVGAILTGVFGLLGLLLTSVGIYGVVTYSVTQRRREIGIRMALGANHSDLLKLVIGQSMKMVLTGLALGLVISAGLARLISGFLFGVSAVDPVTLVGISALLLGVAMLAIVVPARRAMNVDPLIAIRAV